MKSFCRDIDVAGLLKRQIVGYLVDAFKDLIHTAENSGEWIEPYPYDICLYVSPDLYLWYHDELVAATTAMRELTKPNRDGIIHALRDASLKGLRCKMYLRYHERNTVSISTAFHPLCVSPLRFKDLYDVYKPTGPKIKKVIFNPPATIVYWGDGSKTVSKVQDGDTWDSEKGLAMAIIKKTIGLKEFYKHFDGHAVKNTNFWYGAVPEALVKASVEKYGFELHMDAIVSKYGTDMVERFLKSVKENGMDIKGE